MLIKLALLIYHSLAVIINTYNASWFRIDTRDSSSIVQQWNNTGLPAARYYHIGTHSNILRVKEPFDGHIGGGRVIIPIILACADFTRGRDVSVMLEISDWGDVASGPLCSGSNCTDVLILGTTQMASRVADRDIISLNNFMNDYAAETGTSFTDNFVQQYIYDYFYNGEWMGVPLVSDTRLIHYNRTLFDQLNLTHPPPTGDWGTDYWNTWNWRKFFEYAKIIKDAGFPYGMFSRGSWDEELKWITLVAREFNSTLLNRNGTCGYSSPNFRRMLDEFLIPLFKNGIASTTFYPKDNPDAIAYANSTHWVDPLEMSNFCCENAVEDEVMAGFMPMKFLNPAKLSKWSYRPSTNFSGIIGVGFVPGRASFLGGSGIAIVANSKLKEFGWQLITVLTSARHSSETNYALGVPPPYHSARELPLWTSPEYSTATRQVILVDLDEQSNSYSISSIFVSAV
jgi:ABC-type glycerol-3-phosphate transport system substrate-binding protein